MTHEYKPWYDTHLVLKISFSDSNIKLWRSFRWSFIEWMLTFAWAIFGPAQYFWVGRASCNILFGKLKVKGLFRIDRPLCIDKCKKHGRCLASPSIVDGFMTIIHIQHNDFIFRWLQLEVCLMNPFAYGISFPYVSALTKKICGECFNLISSLPNDLAGPVDVKLYKTEADTTGSSDNAVVLIQYVNNCVDYHSPCCNQRWSVWGSLSCEAICSVLPVIVHINWLLHWNIGR